MNRKVFVRLFFAFIAFTIIGTLSHELGHYIAGNCLGYEMSMNYATTYIQDDAYVSPRNSFLITLGGPIQTLLTGTIGCVLLFSYRKGFQSVDKLSSGQWIMVFVSLFWLRQVANLTTWLGSYLINGEFSQGGDELRIAGYLGLSEWSILVPTAIAGFIVLTVVFFKFIPFKQRFTFLLSGLIGGIAGYLFWLLFAGKYIMP
nr:hypothetical protein [uncultured Fluviicola sp.]